MRFIKLYWSSRLVHINVNAIIAGILSILIATQFVYLTRHLTDHPFVIALLSYLFDGIIDFVIFAILHGIIYHSRVRRLSHAQTLASDLTLLQSHRLLLSVVTFSVSVGLHWALMHVGIERVSAFILAYAIGLVITRAVHTWYGLRIGLFEPLKFKRNRA